MNHVDGIVLTQEIVAAIDLAVANPRAPVILQGETGTGKEEIAKIIHRKMGVRMPFVCVNCVALQGDLVLSTLFGHRRGSFTGAVDSVHGAVEAANGGILFLDEFQRLSLSVQEMLLRTLQDGSYSRVGEHVQRQSSFRLIISVHKTLDQYVQENVLSPDLRHRLYGVDIKVPPLRERFDQMADFIDAYCSRQQVRIKKSVKTELTERCSQFYWQGNVRQLFGVLDSALIKAHASGLEFSAEMLPIHPLMLAPNHESQPTETDEALNIVGDFIKNPSAYEGFLDRLEKSILSKFLGESKSIGDLCKKLDIPRSTMDGKRRRLGLVSNA